MELYEEYADLCNEAALEQADCQNEGKATKSRTEEIVEWLAESKLANEFRNGEMGFFVSKGPQVRLKDGAVLDLLEWLFTEGVEDSKVISGYSISYSGSDSAHGEKLSFSKVTVDAPFSLSQNGEEGDDLDDDIPF